MLLGLLALYLLDLALPAPSGVVRATGLEPILIAAIVGAASGAAQYGIAKLRQQTPDPIEQGSKVLSEITTSRYGESIGRGYGNTEGVEFAGKWIYRAAKAYISSQTIQGSGKGKPGTTVYRQFIDCGALVCYNPGGSKVLGVVEVRMDDKIIYPPLGYASYSDIALFINGVQYSGGGGGGGGGGEGGPGGGGGDDGGTPNETNFIAPFDGGEEQQTAENPLPTTDKTNRILLRQLRFSNDPTGGTLPNPSEAIGGGAEAFGIYLGGQEQIDEPFLWYYENVGSWSIGDSPVSLWQNYGVGGNTLTTTAERKALAPSYTNRVVLWWKGLEITNRGQRLPQITARVKFEDGTVKDIIIAEAALVGLSEDDLNLGAVEDIEVAGVKFEDITEPQTVMKLLGEAYSVGFPEVDGKLKAIRLDGGGAGIPTVPASDVGIIQGGIEETTTEREPHYNAFISQTEQIPQRIELTHIDPNRKHQPTTTAWGRQTASGVGVIKLNWPIVLTTEQASRICKVMLYSRWAERIGYRLKMLPKYIKYHPGDLLNITTREGYTTDIRINDMSFAAGNMVEVSAVRVLPEIYTQVGSTTPTMWVPQGLTQDQFPDSVLWVYDGPSIDDDQDNRPGVLVAVDRIHPQSGIVVDDDLVRPTNWFGADVLLNRAGTDEEAPNYDYMGRFDLPANISLLGNSIDAGATSSMDVLTPPDFNWQSLSDEEWDSGSQLSNMIIVGNEIMQFKTVVSWTGRTQTQVRRGDFLGWRLQTLRRGLRGTKDQGHGQFQPCVHYQRDRVKFVPLSSVNEGTYNWRAVSVGQYIQATDVLTFDYHPESNTHTWAVSYQIRNLDPYTQDSIGFTDEVEIELA